MPRSLVIFSVVAVIAGAGLAIGAATRCGTHTDMRSTASTVAHSGAGEACESGATTAAATQGTVAEDACAGGADKTSASQGGIAGNFDLMMAGCQFACGTKQEYQASDIHAQPGACAGQLTQCPVSGAVFTVDEQRPRVHVGEVDYVTCCDQCAEKLKRDPGRYLKA